MPQENSSAAQNNAFEEQKVNSSPKANTEVASPNLGDLGLLESNSQRELSHNDDVSEETMRNMSRE